MGKLYNSGSPTSKVYNVSLNAPFDTRLTVQNVADLTDGENGGIASLVYRGMVVYVHQDKSLYIYTGASNGTWKNKNTGKLINGGDINNWKKLIVDPVDALEFYEGIFTKKEELADFLTSSDLEDYVKVEDIADVTSGFVTESDLDVYVKTTDLVDFVKSEDIKDFAKKEDLVDFLTASDVLDFVKVDELNTILSEEVFSKFVSQSDLDVYVKTEDLVDFVTSSELDARIAAIDIPEVPTDVSAFRNDAGYLTKNDLPDFLTASDVEDFVRVDELERFATKDDIVDFVSQSDLEVYAKVVDVVELLEKEDYAKKGDLKDFLTGSDVEDFVKISDIADVVRTDDLDLYVKTEDAIEFLTASDIVDVVRRDELNAYVKLEELPDFLLASDLDGYVKTEDLEAYIPKTELDKLATKSDLDGYVKTADAVEFLTASDLDGFATIDKIPTAGSFPETVDSPTTTSNGFATVQDVMDYVNALLEKKKESDYFYINAIKYTGSENPTPIYQMNCYEIGEEVELSTYNPAYTGTGFAIEVKCDTEVYGFYDKDDPSVTIYAEVLTIDIPDGYTLEVHGCDESGNYFITTEPMKVNYKGATKQYGSKTYNSYARSISDPYGDGRDLITGSARYLIIIKKIN